jgi:putative nucleotidyltransferase with HDIG domain
MSIAIDTALTQLQELFSLAARAGYVGEPLSQAQHALQAADLAQGSGDSELIIAALLHDIGHLCFPDAEAMGNVGVLHHEQLGADYLHALGFSNRVVHLVSQHVDAKRYLVATNPQYANKLSAASQITLEYQGGAMSAPETRRFLAQADATNILRLRAWDEAAKDPNRVVPGFESYLPVLRAHLEQQRLSEDEVARFHRQGYLYLTNIFSGEQIDRLRQFATDLADLPETSGKWMKYFEDSEAGERLLCRIENFVQHHDRLGSWISGPRFSGWVSQLMAEPACLFKEKINFKLAGAGGFEPHQDAPAFTTYGHDYHITLMLSFDRSSEENGCLEVVPGEWPNESLPMKPDLTLAEPTVASLDWQPLPTRPGDIVMFGSYLPHRSGKNLSKDSRRALYATYNRLADGNVRDDYFAEKRRVFPPDVEREPGKTYADSGVFNVGNPVSRKGR